MFLIMNRCILLSLAQVCLHLSSFYLFKALCLCYFIGGNIPGHVRNVYGVPAGFLGLQMVLKY